MKPISVLFRKEWLEMNRSYKLLWLPIVFILLGMLQPIMYYYLPDLLKLVGGLPEGMVMTLPEFTAAEVLASTFSDQFDQLGIIILVISMMGLIVGDKANGMLTFIVSRNTRMSDYIISKWLGQALLIALALAVGLLAAAFYTYYLFGGFSISILAVSLILYYVWCLFIVSLVLAANAIFSRSSVVAVASIIVLMIMKGIAGLGSSFQWLNPAGLPYQAIAWITEGEWVSQMGVTLAVSIILIICLLLFTMRYLERKELPSM